jgi:hypothetical protein
MTGMLASGPPLEFPKWRSGRFPVASEGIVGNTKVIHLDVLSPSL